MLINRTLIKRSWEKKNIIHTIIKNQSWRKPKNIQLWSYWMKKTDVEEQNCIEEIFFVLYHYIFCFPNWKALKCKSWSINNKHCIEDFSNLHTSVDPLRFSIPSPSNQKKEEKNSSNNTTYNTPLLPWTSCDKVKKLTSVPNEVSRYHIKTEGMFFY